MRVLPQYGQNAPFAQRIARKCRMQVCSSGKAAVSSSRVSKCCNIAISNQHAKYKRFSWLGQARIYIRCAGVVKFTLLEAFRGRCANMCCEGLGVRPAYCTCDFFLLK